MKKIFLFTVVIFLSCQNQPGKPTDNGSKTDNNSETGNVDPNPNSTWGASQDDKTEHLNPKENDELPGKSNGDHEIIEGTPISPDKKGSLSDTAMETPIIPKRNSGGSAQSPDKTGTSSQPGNINAKVTGPSNPNKESGSSVVDQPANNKEGNKAEFPGTAAGLPGQSGQQPEKSQSPDVPANNTGANTNGNNTSSTGPNTPKTPGGGGKNDSGTPAKNYGSNKGGLSDTADEAPKPTPSKQGSLGSSGKTPGNYAGNKGSLSDTADESPQNKQRGTTGGKIVSSSRNYAGNKGSLPDTAQESHKPLPPSPPSPATPSRKTIGQTSATNSGMVIKNTTTSENVMQNRRQKSLRDSTSAINPAASGKSISPVKTIQKRIP